MTHQVLVVGDAQFSSLISQRVRGLDVLSVGLAGSADQAERQMLLSPPNLVIGQAGLFEHYSITAYRQHPQLDGVYIVLVEDRPESAVSETLLQQTVEALEDGADAYVWLATEAQRAKLTARLLQLQVKRGLERSRLYRELERANGWLSAIALIDALTQLNNRRALDIELPRQIQAMRDKGYPLSLMMLDIDHFKQVNDSHGHLVGDQVLQHLAERLSRNMRFYDILFRYGGEEFVIILTNTAVAEAEAIGERLCQLIAAEPLTLANALTLTVSVSIGIAGLGSCDDDSGEQLLHRADQNLLRAKRLGRNQVVTS